MPLGLPARTVAEVPRHRDTAFIDGRWTPTTGTRVIEVVDPSTEEVAATVQESSVDDVRSAIAAARRAFDDGTWAATAGRRADVLDELATRLRQRVDELAELATTEIGMPIRMARASQAKAIDYLTYYADLARRHPFAEERLRRDGKTTRIRREPAGTVAAIVPFNGAFPTACMKLGPALAAGCTVVLKPAPETPLAVNALADVLAELTADDVLPPGVVNVVVADRQGSEALVADSGVDKVTFTGSTAVAREIIATTGQRIGRVTLELGGKSAALVLDDASLDEAVPALVMGGFVNSGQACFGLTRVLVSERRRDELVEALADAAGRLVVGDAHDATTTTGPLSMARQRERVECYIALGLEEGARLAFGGGRPTDLPRGYFMEPTILVDVDNAMRVAQEEIFGPVVSVITYRDIDDAVAIANDSPYGLGGAVFCRDPDEGYRIASRIRTGTVSINTFVGSHVTTPFGGFKQSGTGREGGIEGIEPFLETKSVHMPN